jgi:hypothetical protein
MLRVFHNDNFIDYNINGRLIGHTVRLVAKIEITDLNKAFELTNHIDGNWQDNPGVITNLEKCRSTSVGDLIEDEDGHYHVIESLGFRYLTPEEECSMTFIETNLEA